MVLLPFSVTSAFSQDRYNYIQSVAKVGYEWFSDTYRHSGYSVEINMDWHFHKTFYASWLMHIGSYEGYVDRNVTVSGSTMDERFSDSTGEWMVGIGPGADLISNSTDRIFVSLYAGIAGTTRQRDTFNEGGYKEFPCSKKIGVGSVLQLGYEHCFGSGFIIGGSIEGLYIIENINWSAGARLGFRF